MVSVDVAIVGGGIAGLWIANLLARRGLSVVVCEPEGLGGSQTLASQGIVHSGAKYALDGSTAPLTRALKDMPPRWRACLVGRGEVDLRGVPVVAERMRLRSGNTDRDAEIDDFVVDVPALVHRLAEPLTGRVVGQAVTPAAVLRGSGGVQAIELDRVTIRARAYVFAAGTGNEALARHAGFAQPIRTRPLRQTIVRLRQGVRLFAHWARTGAAEPVLTVTSHGAVLSVGGRVADDGVNRSNETHIAVVKALFREAFPGIDLADAYFETFIAERAEPVAAGIRGLSDAFAARRGNCLVCLPVKLSLVPRLGDLVLRKLGALRGAAGSWTGNEQGRIDFASSPYSSPPC